MKKNNNMHFIFTLNGYFNYGNRLQLFALTKVLAELGIKCAAFKKTSLKKKIKEFLMFMTPARFSHKKEVKLRRFTNKYINEQTNYRHCKYAIVGSDQVWNPHWPSNKLFLTEVPAGCVKVSYAASVGVEELSEEHKKMFREGLQNFRAISVREQSAKELLQPLTDEQIEVVLDPTLLLDASEYEKLAKRPKSLDVNDKYILCYILGDKKQRDVIQRFAEKKGFKVILFSDKEGSDYGIEEFLYLIRHAEMICTDSFHACVFSFIFERPFVVFRRSGNADNMYSRIQYFVDLFGLNEHEYNGKSITAKNMSVNYEKAKRILRREQEKSLKFLESALEIEDE